MIKKGNEISKSLVKKLLFFFFTNQGIRFYEENHTIYLLMFNIFFSLFIKILRGKKMIIYVYKFSFCFFFKKTLNFN